MSRRWGRRGVPARAAPVVDPAEASIQAKSIALSRPAATSSDATIPAPVGVATVNVGTSTICACAGTDAPTRKADISTRAGPRGNREHIMSNLRGMSAQPAGARARACCDAGGDDGQAKSCRDALQRRGRRSSEHRLDRHADREQPTVAAERSVELQPDGQTASPTCRRAARGRECRRCFPGRCCGRRR